jgi:hypothetical protein
MAYDWINASPEARRLLYRATKQIVDRHYAGHWSRFYEAVFDRGGVPGSGYEDNFRAGRVSRIKANVIHRWISIHHTQAAIALDSAVTALPDAVRVEDAWQSFIETHGHYGALEIVRLDELAIVGFARGRKKRIATIRRGEAFCLRITSDMAGRCIGLQRSGALWFPLPLSHDNDVVSITAGVQILPCDESGDVMPLSEEADAGRYEFVVLIASDQCLASVSALAISEEAISPECLAALAETLENAPPFAVHRAPVLIT